MKTFLCHHHPRRPHFTGPYDGPPTFARTPEGRKAHGVSVTQKAPDGAVYAPRNQDGSAPS